VHHDHRERLDNFPGEHDSWWKMPTVGLAQWYQLRGRVRPQRRGKPTLALLIPAIAACSEPPAAAAGHPGIRPNWAVATSGAMATWNPPRRRQSAWGARRAAEWKPLRRFDLYMEMLADPSPKSRARTSGREDTQIDLPITPSSASGSPKRTEKMAGPIAPPPPAAARERTAGARADWIDATRPAGRR